MRTGLTLVLVAGLIGTLAACSSTDTVAKGCTPSGAASAAVKVSGDFGKKPKVTIASPVSVEATQRTVSITGDGEKLVDGDEVQLNFSLYNAKTGKELTSTDYTKDTTETFVIDESKYLVGLIKTLECSTVGSRVVGVIPPADAWGDTGSTDLGVAADESIVFVADIVEVSVNKATGKDQPAEEGFPKVTLAKDGAPTVTIPDTAPPAELKISVLKKGKGDVVEDGDTVRVQYQGVNWTSGKVFDQSWGSGSATFATTDVIAGFGQAMVGQAVGSQVIVIIPPELGYGATGNEGASITGTDTLVFVIDILATS